MKKVIRNILISVLVICVVVFAIFFVISQYVVNSTRDNVHTIAQIEESGEHVDAILVLGASVYVDGTPSDILADRLEVACDLYFADVAPAIIVSGDNTDSHYNESDAMKDYCVELGVPAGNIYVDHAGYDTYASVWRAKYVYGAQSVVIVTQAYHLYRALSIAEGLDMRALGVAADKGEYNNQTMYSMRENVARVKDFFQTLFHVEPADVVQPIKR
ncbi:vancomycin high temperature exclusion protein [Adlercreutzia sp. ZJ154]|uniref:SanA/YdcF family protein n=1 Tax=Adlercreutzia sp. ZJ154 TaxID=2709790 RepID=UPI0013EBA56E|nr:ElyC/SanA/YdcF family protein [Adlercreutzia sp. ZJ154]